MNTMPIITSFFRAQPVMTALTTGALASLSGCASNEITEHRIDQPLPFASVSAIVPPCLSLRGDVLRKPTVAGKPDNPFKRPFLHALLPGSSCWFVVQSAVHFEEIDNGTGLALSPEGIYTISIPEVASRTWYDKGRRVPAPQGELGSFITRRLGDMKKNKDYNWFALMAAASESKKARHVDSGSQLACMAGELSFYVNDAHRFYGNNFGNLLVVIKRESESAKEAPCPQ